MVWPKIERYPTDIFVNVGEVLASRVALYGETFFALSPLRYAIRYTAVKAVEIDTRVRTVTDNALEYSLRSYKTNVRQSASYYFRSSRDVPADTGLLGEKCVGKTLAENKVDVTL